MGISSALNPPGMGKNIMLLKFQSPMGISSALNPTTAIVVVPTGRSFNPPWGFLVH